MKKRFNAKNRKFKKIRSLILMAIFVVAFVVTFNILIDSKISEFLNDEKYQTNILNNGLNIKNKLNINLLNPKILFKLSLNHLLEYKEPNEFEEVFIPVDNIENDKHPLIYIYNTHQTESYDSTLLEAYNIKYTVTHASYILRDYLKELSIPVYLEKESMGKYLRENNLKYKDSYKASRFYFQKRIVEYPTLNYFIDIHRDSAKKSTTTVNIDGKSYAKVMFVVGMDYSGFEYNLSVAERLNKKIDPRISRGIIKKTGKHVNGVYNQDLKKNTILIELGGVDNTIEEVNNTLKVISQAILQLLREE